MESGSFVASYWSWYASDEEQLVEVAAEEGLTFACRIAWLTVAQGSMNLIGPVTLLYGMRMVNADVSEDLRKLS